MTPLHQSTANLDDRYVLEDLTVGPDREETGMKIPRCTVRELTLTIMFSTLTMLFMIKTSYFQTPVNLRLSSHDHPIQRLPSHSISNLSGDDRNASEVILTPADAARENNTRSNQIKQDVEEGIVDDPGIINTTHHLPVGAEVKKNNPKSANIVVQSRSPQSIVHLPIIFKDRKRDVSPQALQKRALTFPPSSELRKFLEEQEKRKKHIKATCVKYTAKKMLQGYSLRGGLANILFDSQNQLSFCRVFKAGSSSWTRTMLDLKGMPLSLDQELQPVVRRVFPRLTSGKGSLIQGTTRFTVVRHPLERLLSCYRDKYKNGNKPYYYFHYGERMVRMYRKFSSRYSGAQMFNFQKEVRRLIQKKAPVQLPNNPFADPVGPTFPEFVKYITSNAPEDEHWRPYYKHCALCHIEYDFILKFEMIMEDGKQFLEYLNRTADVSVRWDNPTKGGTSTEDTLCSYYNQLASGDIKKIIKKYEKDFELFEYSPDYYNIRCVNNSVSNR